jgi:hypothetical protein
MMHDDSKALPFVNSAGFGSGSVVRDRRDAVAAAMRDDGLLESPAPPAALRWIDTFLEAYGGEFETAGDCLPFVRALRAESVVLPALELERLRTRQVLFFLDSVSQYVDDQPELRGIPVEADLVEIAKEFGVAAADAIRSVRMVLSARAEGPPLGLLFPLLGHDRIMMRIGAVNSHLLHGRGLEPIAYGPDGKPFRVIETGRPEGSDLPDGPNRASQA